MRIIVVKNPANLGGFISSSTATELEDLQRFNPHLDLKKLKAGSVIVMPDKASGPDSPAGDAKSIGFEAMGSFIDLAKDALAISTKRVAGSADRAKSEEAALAAAVRAKTVKAAMQRSAELKDLVNGAVAQAKSDSATAVADVKTFDTLTKQAQTELEALAKRLA